MNSLQSNTPAADSPEVAALREKLKGTTINEQTFLATDYLNHINEIIMMIEMIPDMPECFEDAKSWHPKSYEEHFRDSSFSDKELAIKAYQLAPSGARNAFDYAVERMNQIIQIGLDEIEKAIATGERPAIEEKTTKTSRALQKMIDVASSIIHGGETTLDQEEIDRLI